LPPNWTFRYRLTAKLSRNRHPTATTPSAHVVYHRLGTKLLPLHWPESRAGVADSATPGVGPITASLIATKIAHIGLFKSARYLAASAFDVSSDWNPPSRTSA
jgi:hypothetical protein